MAEAQTLFDFVANDICPLFVPPDQVEDLMEKENWEDYLLPIERQFYNLWEEIYDMVEDFIMNNEE